MSLTTGSEPMDFTSERFWAGTRAPLEELLRLARADGCPLEIETYTFEALPEGRRARLGVPTLLDGLEREFRWAASVA